MAPVACRPCCCICHRAGAINGPHLEMYHYLTTYSTGTLPTTFTGMMPPIAAQVRQHV